MKINQIYCADCLKLMKEIDSNSVDAIITDPPYGTNYGKVANDETTKVFVQSMIEKYRVLKEGSFYITYCFPLYVPEIIEEAQRAGFTYRWIGFNYYPNMFKQKPQPLGYNRYDLFLVFSKGEAKKRGYIKDTIHVLMDKQNHRTRDYGHPHQKPEKCAQKLIKATTNEGDLILDPFCGSGVFCATAKAMNRNYIGIDIENKYCDLAKEMIKNIETKRTITRGN